MILTLQQIQKQAYATACEKGWHERPLMPTSHAAAIYGDTCPGARVFVLSSGNHKGRLCAEGITEGDPLPLPGMFFGRKIDGNTVNPPSVEVRTVQHDRVLRSHALMHTELTEAHDCFAASELAMHEVDGKPEGMSVEIADVIIRVCDTTEALGLPLCQRGCESPGADWLTQVGDMRPAWEIRNAPSDTSRGVAVLLWLGRVRCFIDQATEAARDDAWDEYAEKLTIAVLYAASIVVGLGQDLGAAIEAKMAYNKTRPHRHGGKQA